MTAALTPWRELGAEPALPCGRRSDSRGFGFGASLSELAPPILTPTVTYVTPPAWADIGKQHVDKRATREAFPSAIFTAPRTARGPSESERSQERASHALTAGPPPPTAQGHASLLEGSDPPPFSLGLCPKSPDSVPSPAHGLRLPGF